MSLDLAKLRSCEAQVDIALSALEQARADLRDFVQSAANDPAPAAPAPVPAAPIAAAGVQDLKAFFVSVRGSLWPKLTQDQVDGCKALLAAGAGILILSWMAYVLATAYHETTYTMQPIRERGNGDRDGDGVDDWFEQYDTGAKAIRLGNTPAADGDGALFCGRGYVQLTGRANYQKATIKLRAMGLISANDNLETTPDLALRPDLAAVIAIQGMVEGWFTGVGLRKFLNNTPTLKNYTGARAIINGTDKAAAIAGYAVKFEVALRAAGWA